jgi:hypothetical protein
LLTAPWSDTLLTATNTALAGHEAGGTTVQNWPAGATNSFIIVGWSGNLAPDWATLETKLNGASLLGSDGAMFWSGGGLGSTSDGLPGFLGATVVGFREAGGVVGANTIPPPVLFASVPDSQGNPIIGPTTLWTTAPEPTACALVGLAVAIVATTRRKPR